MLYQLLIYSASSGFALFCQLFIWRNKAGRSNRVLSRSRMREIMLRLLEHWWITTLQWWCVLGHSLLLSFQIEGICAWIGVPYLPAQYFRGFGGRWELLNYLTVGLELSSWGRLSSGGLLRGRRILCWLWTLKASGCSGRREGAGQLELRARRAEKQCTCPGLNFALNWLIWWEWLTLVKAVY